MADSSAVRIPRRASSAERLSRISLSGGTSAEPPYAQNLARAEKVTKRCSGCWREFVCPADDPGEAGHTLRTVWADGCESPDCFRCVRKYGARRARRVWKDVLGRLTAWPWWFFVFTIPPSYRDQAAFRPLKHLRRLLVGRLETFLRQRAGRELQQLEGFPPRFDWKIGLLAVLHPEGNESPGLWAPHLNLLVPCVAFADWRDSARPLKPFFSPAELAHLRGLWADCLEDVFEYRVPNDAADGGPRVDLHVQYRGGPPTRKWTEDDQIRRQKFTLEYILRSFPGWSPSTRRFYRYGLLAVEGTDEIENALRLLDLVPWGEAPTCDLCGAELVSRDLEPGSDFDGIAPRASDAARDAPS